MCTRSNLMNEYGIRQSTINSRKQNVETCNSLCKCLPTLFGRSEDCQCHNHGNASLGHLRNSACRRHESMVWARHSSYRSICEVHCIRYMPWPSVSFACHMNGNHKSKLRLQAVAFCIYRNTEMKSKQDCCIGIDREYWSLAQQAQDQHFHSNQRGLGNSRSDKQILVSPLVLHNAHKGWTSWAAGHCSHLSSSNARPFPRTGHILSKSTLGVHYSEANPR